ncbi:MAG: ATP-binding cassette domain-containing protein [Bacilli bacterium]|nr:ATP-binding cassette domain-containing protein [Bacilli bacterium]
MIRLEHVNKYFNKGKKNEIHVINDLNLKLNNNGLVCLLGPSGCGKTTILNAVGGLDKVRNGKIYIDDERITKRSIKKIDKIRNLKVGYIFQDYKLIDSLSVFDNVALVLKMIGIKDKDEIKKRVDYVLETLNIYRYRYRLASMLSGGERQRVAIARAIVKDPDIILADEPTGNLDSKNTLEIMNIIKCISKKRLVILVTHEVNLAKFYADRIIELEDGKVIKDYENETKDFLDYRLENNIYLKDIKYHNDFNDKLNKISVYNDNNNLDITLVVKNGNIYIKSNSNEKIEVIDSNSNVNLIDDHYKKIDYDEVSKYEFNFDKVINNDYKKKYSSIYNLKSMITSGFKKISNYSPIKKFLLLGYMAASMFILFSIARMASAFVINDEDFVKSNNNYVSVAVGKIDEKKYNDILSVPGIKYAVIGDSLVGFKITYNTLLQNYDVSDLLVGSISGLSLISDKDLIYGEMPKNDYEVVVDIMSAKTLFDSENHAKSAGLLSEKDLIGMNISVDNVKDFKIVGITDLKSPSIYIKENLIVDVVNNTSYQDSSDDYYFPVADKDSNYANYETYDYTLKNGRVPSGDYEVLVNYDLKDLYELNKNIDTKINGKKLKVVGYYVTKNNDNNILIVNSKMITYTLFDNNSTMTLATDNKDELVSKLQEKDYNAINSYDKNRNDYIKENKASVNSIIVFTSVILAISLIEIYLMIRSSFLSRIKEVGIYRAIGVKKSDIYKMFASEIMAINLTATLGGIILMGAILYNVSKMKVLGSMVVLNGTTVGLALLISFGFNLIMGLIPVYRVVRKRPSEILARHDI